MPYGSVSQLTSGRIVPRETVANQHKELGEAFRALTSTGNFYLANVAFNGSLSGHDPTANSMMPQWRDLVMYAIIIGPWDWTVPRSEMLERQAELTHVITPLMADLMPGSGVYLNEGNFEDPNWRPEFFGENYGRLLEIKNKYDPEGVLYAITAVGSERWRSDAEGRLCHTGLW
jgi:FAD/FMN-containing dehydrogenase